MIFSKEHERLKWEYLKRSESYLEYCELKKNPKMPIPKKFQTANIPIQDINPIIFMFEKFGDIHAKSFEKWFNVYFANWGKINFGKVDDLSGIDPSMKYFMRNTFIFIIDIFKKKNGREPSLLEMAELLTSLMRHEKDYQSYLKIKQVEFTQKEAKRLSNEVYNILRKRVPKSNNHLSEWQRYLDVYDIWIENDKPKQLTPIIKKTLNYYKNNAANLEKWDISREIRRDLEKAKKIISNIEKDIFPGKY